MEGWMNRGMDGWRDGWMEGWRDERMEGWKAFGINVCGDWTGEETMEITIMVEM